MSDDIVERVPTEEQVFKGARGHMGRELTEKEKNLAVAQARLFYGKRFGEG